MSCSWEKKEDAQSVSPPFWLIKVPSPPSLPALTLAFLAGTVLSGNRAPSFSSSPSWEAGLGLWQLWLGALSSAGGWEERRNCRKRHFCRALPVSVPVEPWGPGLPLTPPSPFVPMSLPLMSPSALHFLSSGPQDHPEPITSGGGPGLADPLEEQGLRLFLLGRAGPAGSPGMAAHPGLQCPGACQGCSLAFPGLSASLIYMVRALRRGALTPPTPHPPPASVPLCNLSLRLCHLEGIVSVCFCEV